MLKKKMLWSYFISIILIIFNTYAQTNVSEGNITLTPYNQSNITPISENQITQSDFERIVDLINELKDIQKLTVQEKDYLNAISERLSKSEQIYTETLKKSQDLNVQLISQLQGERNQTIKWQERVEITFDKLKLQISDLSNEEYKLRVWTWFYIILSFFTGIILIGIIIWLRKRKKLYFILRWIRDRIPIKF